MKIELQPTICTYARLALCIDGSNEVSNAPCLDLTDIYDTKILQWRENKKQMETKRHKMI